jgi:hypothetical protein
MHEEHLLMDVHTQTTPFRGQTQKILDVDSIVICAGQEPLKELEAEIKAAGSFSPQS